MDYLLVCHVPFARWQCEGTYLVGDLYLEDLRAEVRALREVGFTVTVASPLRESLPGTVSGSFSNAIVRPAAEGFELAPLPPYLGARDLVRAWRPLRSRLAELTAGADVVQMDYGGHPAMLGELAWRACPRPGPARIWVFDGADPFQRWSLHARAQRGRLRRLAWETEVRRRTWFLERVLAEADAVFAHNRAVKARFAGSWSPRCHLLERSYVTEELLLAPEELEARRARLANDPVLRLVMAGRQIRIKGTDHALRALALAREAGARLELDVWGEGEDLDAFRTLAAELGLNGAVRFRGSVPYGPALFAGWDEGHAMVVANLTPELSRNVLLSLARGLPLVTYRNPGTDALLSGHEAAWLVESGDVQALGAAFVRLARERQAACRLAERGLSLARLHTLGAQHRQRARIAADLVPAASRRAAL